MPDKSTIPVTPGYTIEKFYGLAGNDLMDQIYKLRVSVWKETGTRILVDFPEGKWHDDEEAKSTHWIAFHTGRPIAACRMTIYSSIEEAPDAIYYRSLLSSAPCPLNYLTRDFVINEHRANGLGRYFNLVRLEESEKAGVKTIFSSIPEYRIDSFLRLGFEIIRPPKPGTLFPEMKWTIVAKYL